MKADCHIHMVLDGADWRAAIARHRSRPNDGWIRQTLARYRALGFTYLRDGGDRWGVGKRARELAGEYGITYRTPLSPLYKAGHYGSFIGEEYSDLSQYADLVRQARAAGADLIKLMVSGLMDFNCFGRLTEDALKPDEIRELVHIAHEEGFPVMVHANGAGTVEAAAAAGADSIEHGAYLDDAALYAMVESHCIWCPTLSTVGNLRGKGRFHEGAVRSILENAMENVEKFDALGGFLAPGTDAGAWAVPHGSLTEYALLGEIFGGRADAVLERGTAELLKKF